MARRDAGGAPPVKPPPAVRRRASRIAEARGYHPRGRTLGDEDRGGAGRPDLRLVTSDSSPEELSPEEPSPDDSRSGSSRSGSSRSGSSRSGSSRSGSSRSGSSRSGSSRATHDGGGPRTRRAGGRDTSALAGSARSAVRRVVTRSMVAPPLADQGRRLRLATVLVLVLFGVIGARLVQFQLTDAPGYAALGLELRLQPVDLPAARGSIVDRNGAVLAGSAEARYVYADPELVTDPIAVANALSPLIGVPRSDLLPKLFPHRHADGRPTRFEYLARGIGVETGQRVSDLGLEGIGVHHDETRVVPGHDLAANLIGFTGGDLSGLAGLEASYDEVLRGADGRRVFEIGQPDGDVDLDHEIPGGYHEEEPPRPGSSLRLTIDRDLQFEVQRILAERMPAARATAGAAVVLDPATGEILAQASYPFYDAANPLASQPAERGDAATGMALDPGSVHKAIVFAACLQEGIVSPGDSVLVRPSITKGSVTFTDTHPQRVPTEMTLPGILAWSSNVGTITLADRLGAQKLYEYQRAFGLGQPTGTGLPAESAGLVQPPQNWSAESAGSIPIGMGVSVTPLQMAAVYAAIANGGVWVQPHLVQAVITPDGQETPSPAAPTRRVISAENAASLRTMLEAVVTLPDATGRSATVPDYRVAGKTGTGRLVVDGQYAAGEVASFIGMAPADAPRYVVAVFAHTPGGNGGPLAGPMFAEIMEQALRHYGVAPTGAAPPTFTVYP